LAEGEGFEVTELLAGRRRRRQPSGLSEPSSAVPAIRAAWSVHAKSSPAPPGTNIRLDAKGNPSPS